MTERQAWLRLANGVEERRFYYNGLCMAIDHLYRTGGLPAVVANRMEDRISQLPHRYEPWVWPLDEKGNKARVAYCRRQVARLTRKRKASR